MLWSLLLPRYFCNDLIGWGLFLWNSTAATPTSSFWHKLSEKTLKLQSSASSTSINFVLVLSMNVVGWSLSIRRYGVGLMVSMCCSVSWKRFSSFCNELRCLDGGLSLYSCIMSWIGLVSGSVRCRTAALWQALARASSIGSKFAWVSTKSLSRSAVDTSVAKKNPFFNLPSPAIIGSPSPVSGPTPNCIFFGPLASFCFNIPLSHMDHHIVNPSSRPLIPGIYAPIPSFFLPQSEDLGTPCTSKSYSKSDLLF